MPSMTTAAAETAIWARVIAPQRDGLPRSRPGTPPVHLQRARQRPHERLARKNSVGRLSAAERRELEGYVKVGDILSLIHLKARNRSGRNPNEAPGMDPAAREAVRRRAGSRCEYCHLPSAHVVTPFQIEHVVASNEQCPIAFFRLFVLGTLRQANAVLESIHGIMVDADEIFQRLPHELRRAVAVSFGSQNLAEFPRDWCLVLPISNNVKGAAPVT